MLAALVARRDAARRHHRHARPGHRRRRHRRETGETRWVGGSDEFFAGQLAWSPDGRRLAFSGGPGDHPAIGVYELATGSVTWAWEDHHVDAHHPVWAPDGAALAFLVEAEGETVLCHSTCATGP